MIVAIHQPNYLPWLGYFDKMYKSDVFVLLDDVQFPTGKQHYGHRNKIRGNMGEKWLTLPVSNRSAGLKFNEVQISDNGWHAEHLRLITEFYRKTRYFDAYYPILSQDFAECKVLSDITIKYIGIIKSLLKLKTKIVLSSKLNITGTGAERILNILKHFHADTYVSGTGPGSMRYIDEEEFVRNNIRLVWQNYISPEYKQRFNPFIPNLSIIDALFNLSAPVIKEQLISRI